MKTCKIEKVTGKVVDICFVHICDALGRAMLQNYGRRFLPDILFFGLLVALILLSLLLSLLFELSGWVELHPYLSLVAVAPSPQPLPALFNPLLNITRETAAWLNRQNFLTFTDPETTYGNPSVKELWGVFLVIADSVLGILIVLAGYRVMFSGFGSRYGEALEELPRLFSAAVGANISLLFARLWIDLNNLMCTVLVAQTANHQPFSILSDILGVASLTIFTLFLMVPLILLILLLAVQMAVRLGLILVLMVWLPVLFIMLANHHTRQFGQAGIIGYVTAVMVQSLQITCIVIGVKVLIPFLSVSLNSSLPGFINSGLPGFPTELSSVATILAGIALFWITLRIPSMLRHWALQPVAESSQAVRAIISAVAARALYRL